LTGIAGVLAPSEAIARSRLALILGAMESRGRINHAQLINGPSGFLALGSCSHLAQERGSLSLEQASIVLDGDSDSLQVEEIGGQVDDKSISEALVSPGAFSLLAISEGRLLASRDAVGQKPLYFGGDAQGMVGFASLKNALREAGIQNPLPVPPGQVITVRSGKPSILVDKSLARPVPTRVSESEASTRLKTLLVESLSDNVPKDLALAFSGGLDSSIVARAAQDNDLRPELITVGMKGQPEIKHAKEVSKQLGLDITTRELSKKEVLEALPRVASTIESTDPVLVGVSVPLFFACEIAEEMGSDCFLAGQLSDELFGGYGRFDQLAERKDAQSTLREIWRSVIAASANDFEPGDKLAVSHHLSLKCPFAFLPFVEYALKLPISLKLRIVQGRVVRKYILRRLAAEWNLPESVVNRPKKAVQYSTGIQRILLKEAKRRRTTLEELLRRLTLENDPLPQGTNS
jgi:asparagine synthase (glutamine-hydrolysing)